jgi:hypothetical protein
VEAAGAGEKREEVNEDEQIQAARERVRYLKLLAEMAETAAKSEERAIKIAEDARLANSACTYWSDEARKHQTRIRELEDRVRALESPLAELARGCNDSNNNNNQ